MGVATLLDVWESFDVGPRWQHILAAGVTSSVQFGLPHIPEAVCFCMCVVLYHKLWLASPCLAACLAWAFATVEGVAGVGWLKHALASVGLLQLAHESCTTHRDGACFVKLACSISTGDGALRGQIGVRTHARGSTIVLPLLVLKVTAAGSKAVFQSMREFFNDVVRSHVSQRLDEVV